mgnify:CR=1 FL=1
MVQRLIGFEAPGGLHRSPIRQDTNTVIKRGGLDLVLVEKKDGPKTFVDGHDGDGGEVMNENGVIQARGILRGSEAPLRSRAGRKEDRRRDQAREAYSDHSP